MKVKVKDPKGTVNVVEVEGSWSVSALKQEAIKMFGLDASSPQSVKLIFRGKLLADDKTLDSYDVKEDSVIVVMAVKKTAEQTQAEKDYEDHRAVDYLLQGR